ncbi:MULTISPECIES: hypothetical protein [Kitasatospora]|uniref:Uncharacterized protein n=1 Tax=Kitasatospora setae (strain ATCC 33774 / DSM 43861 / JCM 3304 / KCC A-0304 / NBRC 14216 / KM-6054) TaxID=452652 RepID=E4N7W8_KITSK|nr:MULTISPECIES: hypothetical protein [Kitasatospora]BAJ27299.1 hypothetical protein KSE_14710 [Kitasatospora setae KM-6054]
MIITLGERALARLRDYARLPGYRGPLVLAALLAAVLCLPHGSVHGALMVACVLAGFLGTLLTVLFVPVTLPLLALVLLPAGWLAHRHRARLRPPARPGNSVLLGCALGVTALLLGCSVPGADYGLLGLGAFTLLALPGGWLLWQQTPWAHRDAPAPGRWRWAAVPLLLTAGALLIHYDVPADARFAASRDTLTTHARHTLATGSTDAAWVAGYRLEHAELASGGVTFTIAGAGVFAPHGYAYLPQGLPAKPTVSYTDLGGGWYSWSGADHF